VDELEFELKATFSSPEEIADLIICIPLTGKIDVFSLRGPPAYYTSIGLGTSRRPPLEG
jgi:hypothetical protein